MSGNSSREGVAIIGCAGRFPLAENTEQFWNNLVSGKDCFTEFSIEQIVREGVTRETAARPEYIRRAPVLADPAGFDAALFRYSPREAELIDPQQRILLECAWEALEHAGHDPHRFPGTVGVWAGSGVNNYFLKNLLSRGSFEQVADFQTIISNDKDYLASRVAYKLDLRGPAIVVQTACSSSLVAVHLACLSLMTYQCDLALAGAAFLQTPRARGYLYREGEIFSSDGYCRTFDKGANGTVLGEGCGMVVLRRLEEAIAENDNILAIIRGSAVNNDGAARAGYTAPGLTGQMELITMAQAVAGVQADEISYIEAHGTGTALGDPIEVNALTQAFRRTTTERGFCGLGSVKTNIGHLDVAAGMAGLIKTIYALQHRQLPPTLHFTEPNPELRLGESPFYIVDRLTEWEPRHGSRIAGVSSFGMGGTNAHLILEEYTAQEAPERSRRLWHLLPFSAATATTRTAAGTRLSDFLKDRPEDSLADIAWTLTSGRVPLRFRECVVADSAGNAAARISRPDALFGVDGDAEQGQRPIVFLFSGQGTQYPGMGDGLYRTEPAFRESMDRCSRILGALAGPATLIDILYSSESAKADLINQTGVSQPALFAFGYSLARVLGSWGIRPSAVIGHSIGEYNAAFEAGVFSLETALHLVRERGRLMQSMAPGTMIALPRSEAEVREMLPSGLDLAVVNAPSITVVSGPTNEIETFEKQLEAQGMQFRRLHTSHGFHSRMMDSAANAFADVFQGVRLKAPELPMASNLSGGWMNSEASHPEYWAKHLRSTVRFSDNLAAAAGRFGSAILLEVGPGNTLCSIARQHAEPVAKLPSVTLVRHPRQQVPDEAFFLRGLGALWCHGANIDLRTLYAGQNRKRVPLPAYPFDRQQFWIGMDTVAARSREAEKKKKPGRLRGAFTMPFIHRSSNSTAKQGITEEDLIRIWCSVLGTSRIGQDDNFFELGGHSLLAVSIMTELEKNFGKRLPLAMLIQAPTIRQLARLLQGQGSETAWSNLVPLSTLGSKPPFFLMHSHGGNILEYQALASLLKNDRPIYALQCSGLDGSPMAESSVEEMAARYLQEIRRVQPKGPYYLGGYCFGGILSIEIAQLLRTEQEEVSLIVMINSATHLVNVFRPDLGPAGRKLYALQDRLALEWDGLQAHRGYGKVLHLAARTKRTWDVLKTRTESVMDRFPEQTLPRNRRHSLVYHLEQIADANDRAWERYRPRPYDGKVLFLRAGKQPSSLQPNPLLGWGGVLTGEVHVHEVPGFRQMMLEQPQVLAVARRILEHLP